MSESTTSPSRSTPTVSVRGFARSFTKPDWARISVEYRQRSDDRDAAIREAAEAVQNFRDDFSPSDLVRSLTMGQMSVTRERVYNEETRVYEDGLWEVSVSGRIEVDADNANDVLGGVVIHPLDVDYVSWGIEDDNPLCRQVRRAAVRNAREAAEDFADGASMQVGDVIALADPELLDTAIRARFDGIASMPMEMSPSDDAVDYSPDITLDPQPVYVSATVEAVFELR